ncbi:hypothetical protein PIB30_063834 [Stylosanthes scabra]|uniref:Uncharacterized protein n=1 Tax=Stylosanthes scabra TaxID=79078 RepID=A0ABU6TLT3_9FABA|nr:hypothetical protein [Stylosanthes scabra]
MGSNACTNTIIICNFTTTTITTTTTTISTTISPLPPPLQLQHNNNNTTTTTRRRRRLTFGLDGGGRGRCQKLQGVAQQTWRRQKLGEGHEGDGRASTIVDRKRENGDSAMVWWRVETRWGSTARVHQGFKLLQLG